jgi:hypothetical protein
LIAKASDAFEGAVEDPWDLTRALCGIVGGLAEGSKYWQRSGGGGLRLPMRQSFLNTSPKPL